MFGKYGSICMLSELHGKVIKKVAGLEKYSNTVSIFTECGKQYVFYHRQDCCESVYLEDFDGYPDDLAGAYVLSAEVVSGDEPVGYVPRDFSNTWTFYKIETNKGGIWMRWLGESNGYYSESVSFELVDE